MNNKVKKTVVEEPFKKRLQYKTFKYCKSLYSLQQTHGTDTAAWNVCVGMKNQTNLVGSKEAKEMSQQATHALADLVRYTENLVFKEGYDGMAVHKEKKSVIEKFLDNKKIK
ncbi:hypothetical protein ACTFIZ_007376 [Dictyostelium cf. discoideum]